MENYTLITGASSGIGKELARVFASKGHSLILVARRGKLLNELATEIKKKFKTKVLCFPCDLSAEDQVDMLAEKIQQQDFFVDVLINNAGIGDFSAFASSDAQKLQKVIAVNINAVVSLTHHLLPGMLERKQGKILNLASLAAFSPGPYIAVYAAAKSFILNFSHALAAELKDKGILVSVLCPGDIKTGFQENAGLHGFEVPGKITAEELTIYAYEEFINQNKREIIPPETFKMVEMILKSGSRELLSDNMFKLRKQLAVKLDIDE